MYLPDLDLQWLLPLVFVFALTVGSFLNVVIHRIPVMMQREWDAMANDDAEKDRETYNLSLPASACPTCDHKIRWYENIPLLSYAFLKGKCSECSSSISLRYPFVELLSAITVTYTFYLYGINEISLLAAFFTWALICLIFIDIDHQLLPDRITLPLLWLGLFTNTFNIFTSLESAVYGAIAGYLSLWSVYWAFKLLTGKEGMGYGDFKLLAALGAWVGIAQIPLIILLSSVVGTIFSIIMIVRKKQDQQTPIPFGPYLAIAGWIALLWGSEITNFYLMSSGL